MQSKSKLYFLPAVIPVGLGEIKGVGIVAKLCLFECQNRTTNEVHRRELHWLGFSNGKPIFQIMGKMKELNPPQMPYVDRPFPFEVESASLQHVPSLLEAAKEFGSKTGLLEVAKSIRLPSHFLLLDSAETNIWTVSSCNYVPVLCSENSVPVSRLKVFLCLRDVSQFPNETNRIVIK